MGQQKAFVVKNGLEVSSNLLVADPQTNKVGIGVTNPKYELEVSGRIGATNSYVSGISSVAGILRVGQNGKALTVLDTNLVGVGTDDPKFILDVRAPVSTGQTAINVVGDVTIKSPGSLSVDTARLVNLITTNVNSSGVVTTTTLDLNGRLLDINNSSGSINQYLKSTVSGVQWESFGVYRNRQTFVSAQGQTDYNFLFEDQYLDVYLNGVKLLPGTEYTPILNLSAYSGNIVRLIVPAFAGDIVEITSLINSNDLLIIDGATVQVLDDGNYVGLATGLNFGTGIDASSMTPGFPGITTITVSSSPKLEISSSNTSNVTYPTFVTGTGTKDVYINSGNLSFIPSTGKLGVGVSSPQRNLEVSGDIAFSNRLFVTIPPEVVSTKIGTLSASNRSFIGVNTSGLQVGYGVTVTIGVNLLGNNTTITSIGIGSIGISTFHGVIVGSATTNLTFSSTSTLSSGNVNQVLISKGPNQPATWGNSSVTIENTNNNEIYYPTFSSVSTGTTTLTVDSNSLVYNPSTNSLGIGTISPATELDVAGDVTALNYFGNGDTLDNIVTTVIAGIGINLNPPSGKGDVTIDAYRPTGKTIFVKQTGNDDNTGLSENYAKKSIKAAANVAVYGDTIKVYPGVYVEENPIVLKKTVSVEGTELRNCVVTPKYSYLDLFHVNNGCHITDMSFIGSDMTDGAAVVALQPLKGVAVDRYFDASRMIRFNLDYIASETVGYLTSTSYKNPPFTVVNASGVSTDPVNCKDDIKDIWKCIIHDITRGGNSKCVGAGLSYYSGNTLVHIAGTDPNNYSVKQATIDAIDYSFNVARAVVNNVTWGGSPVGLGTAVTNATYNEVTGITTITAINHGLVKDDAVKIVGLGFTCPSGPGIVTYPTGAFGYIFNVRSVVGVNTFEVVVGQSTLPHTYVSGGTIQKYTNFQNNFTQVKDLGIQQDPLTGFNNAINGCANVISAMKSCVGVVTSIVGFGTTAFTSIGIRTTYPGNSGIGFTTVLGITSAVYNEETGKLTISSPNLKYVKGESIEIRDLNFSCNSGGGISTQAFPSGRYGYDFYIDKINPNGSYDVYVGPSTIPHSYVGGGVVVNRAVAITTASYNHTTGITTIRANGLSIETGDLVKIRGLEFSCPSGSGTTTIYPTGNNGYEFKVLDIITDKSYGITSAIYDNVSGITTITAPGIGVTFNDIIELKNLEFSCTSGAGTTTLYPTGNNGYKFRVLNSIGSTFTVNVGPSTISHSYVSGGTAINRTKTANDTFTINVGSSTIPHTYVSGGIAIPPFSRGVGPITQGPYVRNCTNFIPKSIGMKVDGFEAEPGDKDDIGVTGTMSVDSYTQYNQGGIGVSVTNGAYSQLVSIFTICDDIGIYTESGGQCDITNSNCSFGNYGLYSKGVGDNKTKSIYRYTGIARTDAESGQAIIEVSGTGNLRPYDGQAIYFGELYYVIKNVKVTNGGSGYTQSPVVTIDEPKGPDGIRAEASANIDSSGKVTSIDIISTGSQYRIQDIPKITIAGPEAGTTATATLELYPIYYSIESASLPSAGISTIVLTTNLNNRVGTGTTVYFTRLSLQIATSISLEWVGAGTNINTAKPALGGVTIQDNEVFKDAGGQVVYTSTNQAGNFQIGDDIRINQLTGTISGRAFNQSILNTVTPLIIALGN